MLSERTFCEGQNHLFCDDKISGFRNWFIEKTQRTKAGITRNCDFLGVTN